MKVKTTPYAYSDEPYEGPNNFPRPFGRLDGNHRLTLLLLPFLLSREEKGVGVRGRSPCESPNTSYANQTHPMKAQTTFRAHPDEPYESPQKSLHLSGQLEGDHRLDLLLLPFLLSREEKEVRVRGRSPSESPNEPPAPTKRTP